MGHRSNVLPVASALKPTALKPTALKPAVLALTALTLAAGVTHAQETPSAFPSGYYALTPVGNPANLERAPAPTTADTNPFSRENHVPTYQMPAIDVNGESGLRSEDAIGTYGQPRWTADRRFTTTRVYVIPEGKVEVEYWLRGTYDRNHTNEFRNLFELELGLGHRLQLDIYFRDTVEDNGPATTGVSLEGRYALADWGKIWGNPTLYLEWTKDENSPDTLEGKLLFGGNIAPRWNWGANLSTEWELSGELSHEWEILGGLSYTLIDDKLFTGVESYAQFVDVAGDRGDFTQAYFVGPDIQWKPLPQVTINLLALAAFGPDAPYAQTFVNIGYEF